MKIFWEKPILLVMFILVIISCMYGHIKIVGERQTTAIAQFNAEGVDPDKYMKAIDFREPVVLYEIEKGDIFIQYQTPNSPQGNFYGFDDSKPTELGISDIGWDPKLRKIVKKERHSYRAVDNFYVLSSYAAPVKDDWSTPEIETQTKGHKRQLFTTCKVCFEQIK